MRHDGLPLTEEQEQLTRLVADSCSGSEAYGEQNGYEEFPWPLFRKLGEMACSDPVLLDRRGGLELHRYASCSKKSHMGSLWAGASVSGLPQ